MTYNYLAAFWAGVWVGGVFLLFFYFYLLAYR